MTATASRRDELLAWVADLIDEGRPWAVEAMMAVMTGLGRGHFTGEDLRARLDGVDLRDEADTRAVTAWCLERAAS